MRHNHPKTMPHHFCSSILTTRRSTNFKNTLLRTLLENYKSFVCFSGCSIEHYRRIQLFKLFCKKHVLCDFNCLLVGILNSWQRLPTNIFGLESKVSTKPFLNKTPWGLHWQPRMRATKNSISPCDIFSQSFFSVKTTFPKFPDDRSQLWRKVFLLLFHYRKTV